MRGITLKNTRIAVALVMGASLLGMQAAVATTHSDVQVTGSGSTFVLNAMEQWKADFKTATGVVINYAGVGSGAGRTALLNKTVDFAGSDVAASTTPGADGKSETDNLKAAIGNFVYIPESVGGIAVFYKVAGFPGLKLTGPTIAKIFKGDITNWNDPAITADNGSAGPNLAIQAFVRSDKSGTSGVFTDYLSKAGGGAWTAGSTQQFPVDHGQLGKSGSDGVANAVAATEGGIGYAEHSFEKERVSQGIAEVSVKNASGAYTKPLAENVAPAIEDATQNADGTLTLNFLTTVPAAYPISTVTYLMAPVSMDPAKGDNLKAFVAYIVGDAEQNKAVLLGYAALGTKVRTLALAQTDKVNPVAATTTTTAAPVTTTTTKPVVIKAAVAPADPTIVSTGANSDRTVMLGALLLALGGACALAGRRRQVKASA
ncbi:MAG: phosphate transport system substrate-binding protein [Actinomycetota bacterium]|nr:phosphate transport system substrate-binding protein [Actinomycetota bacterium]